MKLCITEFSHPVKCSKCIPPFEQEKRLWAFFRCSGEVKVSVKKAFP